MKKNNIDKVWIPSSDLNTKLREKQTSRAENEELSKSFRSMTLDSPKEKIHVFMIFSMIAITAKWIKNYLH